MSDLADYRYLWDLSAPQWVLAQLDGQFFPFNTLTGELLSIVDGEPDLMPRILQHMQEAGRPRLNYVDWQVQRSSPEDVLKSVERILNRVWRIRTRSTRELGAQALHITAPLTEVQARLREPHDHDTLLQAAKTVWGVHFELLALERTRRP